MGRTDDLACRQKWYQGIPRKHPYQSSDIYNVRPCSWSPTPSEQDPSKREEGQEEEEEAEAEEGREAEGENASSYDIERTKN